MQRTHRALAPIGLFLALACFDHVATARAATPAPQRLAVEDPSIVGQWSEVMSWPNKAVHSLMLHTGKVLWYRGEGNPNLTYLWDPVTLQNQAIPFGANIFCSGQSFLPDGRVLVSGGRISGSEGPNHTFVFDPVTEQWTQGPFMREGRYYPTHTSLGNGRTVLVGGYDENEVENELVELFVPGGGPAGADRIDLIPNANHFMAYYPRMHLLPSGKMFHVGKEPESETFDPETGAWTPVAVSNHGSRRDGTSVMLPPGFSKFMILSGGTNTVEVIDLDEPTPTWRYTEPMSYKRLHANNLILPDGKVLVSGGQDGSTFIYPAEIYDPQTERWTVVAPMHTWRVYHSSAVLLPDGRCLWAGADGNHTAEIYSPPYLFRGARPVIDAAPPSVEYGEPFHVATGDASSITSVVLIRLSATTHSVNMEQRYVPLTFGLSGPSGLNAVAPSDPNIAPPGYYMLFILNGNGVPAVAKFIRIGGVAAPAANRAPSVGAGPDQIIPLLSAAELRGTVSDDGLPEGGASTVTWSKVSGPGIVTFADSLSAATQANFSLSGVYVLRFTAFDGELGASDELTIDVREPGDIRTVMKRRVAAGADDAEERPGGSVSTSSSDLELVFDGGIQTVGLRFTGVDIPQGATIYSAYIQFMADEAQSEATSLVFHGQAADLAASFTSGAGGISGRPQTTKSVTWSPDPWTAGDAGAAQKSGDLTEIIQEIVDRPNWSASSLAILISGTGHRTAESFEGNPQGAPELCVEYGFGAARNRAPRVYAGPDQSIELGAFAALNGSAEDDDGPEPLANLWRHVAGPGEAFFDDRSAAVTTVSFSEGGSHALSFTSFDGENTVSDTVVIVVREPCRQARGPGLFLGADPIIVDTQVATGADDVEEAPSGSLSTSSSDLELVFDGGLQTIGLRFTGIAIPQGATIATAYIQFMADESQSEATTLTFRAQDSDSANGFTSASNVSSRPTTDAAVTWSPAPWTAGEQGLAQKTPDLSAVFQEVVDRPNWAGRSLAVIITGSGHRTAESYEGNPIGAARLYIEVGCTGENRPPTADAGPDQTITLPASAVLTGEVQDDGPVTAEWNKVSGPGTVSFVDPTSAHTSASFSTSGDYVLSLNAFDGASSVSDSVGITVLDPIGPAANQPPRVYAGPDQAIDLGDFAALNGSAEDDDGPNALVSSWRLTSGPDEVSFADSNAVMTTASFATGGTYALSLTAFDGEITVSDTMIIAVREPCRQARGPGLFHEPAPITVERQVVSGADDVEQRAGGSISASSSDLELVFDGGPQVIGLRFTGIAVPQGATIATAYIQFMADESQSEATTLTFLAQDSDSANAFTSASGNVSARPVTDATVTWSPAPWTAGEQGPAQKTPDLSAVFQEVVDRPNWAGRSLVIIITGSGHRTAESYEGNPIGAARLYIEVGCTGENRPPTADAGPDQTITLPAAAILAGEVHDDGLPHPPDEVTAKWSKVSGPGDMFFVDDISAHTSASFSASGDYVLSLTAFDGAFSVSDSVRISVREPGAFEARTLVSRVATGNDDAEENAGGSISLTSSDLELVEDGGAQTIGLRFTGIDIPQGAPITKAYVQFTADEAQSVPTTLTIQAHDADNAPGFTSTQFDISSRPRTVDFVTWSPDPWARDESGPLQQTPDLAQVIQRIVDRPNWARNAIAIIITGSGHRTAESFEGSGAAALLHIEFEAPPAAMNPRAAKDVHGRSVVAITRLGRVFPTPGPGVSTVQFDLAREAEVHIEVYDLRGALVRTLLNGRLGAGPHTTVWDGRDRAGRQLVNGVYLLRFAAAGHRETRKLVIVR